MECQKVGRVSLPIAVNISIKSLTATLTTDGLEKNRCDTWWLNIHRKTKPFTKESQKEKNQCANRYKYYKLKSDCGLFTTISHLIFSSVVLSRETSSVHPSQCFCSSVVCDVWIHHIGSHPTTVQQILPLNFHFKIRSPHMHCGFQTNKRLCGR